MLPGQVLPSCALQASLFFVFWFGPWRHILPVVQDTPSYEKSDLTWRKDKQHSEELGGKTSSPLGERTFTPGLGDSLEKSPETQASSTSLQGKYEEEATEATGNRTGMRTELVI